MNETFLEPSMKFYNITFDTNSTDWTIFSNVELNLVMSTECPRSRGLLSLEFISKGSVNVVEMEIESLL